MAYNKAQVTDAGNALFAQILANKSSLSIDKIEISNVQLAASTVITSMTKIDNVVQTTSANGLQKSGNSFIISTAVSNANVTTDYQAWVFGIWGSDSANGISTLIEVITTTGTPDTIPAYSGSTPVTYNYKFATALSNASSISLSMSNDAFATNDTVLHTSGNETSTGTKTFEKIEVSNSNTPDVVLTDGASISLDSGESKFTPANNSMVVHTTGDEMVDGKKAFKVDPTDGAGNAYAKTVDVNQQLDKKVNVSDMRKPASDVVGLDEIQSSILPNGTDLYTLINTSGQPLSYHVSTYAVAQTMANKPTTKLSAFKLNTASIGDSTSSNYNYTFLTLKDQSDGSIYEAFLNTNGSGVITVSRPWYKVANDSKVVHISDMRKPANDVAGIEEVNAVDAKSLARNLITNSGYMVNLDGWQGKNGGNIALSTHSFYHNGTGNVINLINPKTSEAYAISDWFKVKPNTQYTFQFILFGAANTTSTDVWLMGQGTNATSIISGYVQSPIKAELITKTFTTGNFEDAFIRVDNNGSKDGNSSYLAFTEVQLEEGTVAHPWTPSFSDLVHRVADNGDGSIRVNGNSYTPADDSKVAHLSGANNFDTTPTVNNNPLLLASSLPSDLARTGQDTNFTAGLQSGGVNVATAADLKSVEDSAWRQLDLGSSTGTLFAQVNTVSKSVKLSGLVHPVSLLSGTESVIIPKQSNWSFSVPATKIIYFSDTVNNGNGGPDSITISSDLSGNLIASNSGYSSNLANTLFVFTKSIVNDSSDLETIFTDLNPITFSIK